MDLLLLTGGLHTARCKCASISSSIAAVVAVNLKIVNHHVADGFLCPQLVYVRKTAKSSNRCTDTCRLPGQHLHLYSKVSSLDACTSEMPRHKIGI